MFGNMASALSGGFSGNTIRQQPSSGTAPIGAGVGGANNSGSMMGQFSQGARGTGFLGGMFGGSPMGAGIYPGGPGPGGFGAGAVAGQPLDSGRTPWSGPFSPQMMQPVPRPGGFGPGAGTAMHPAVAQFQQLLQHPAIMQLLARHFGAGNGNGGMRRNDMFGGGGGGDSFQNNAQPYMGPLGAGQAI